MASVKYPYIISRICQFQQKISHPVGKISEEHALFKQRNQILIFFSSFPLPQFLVQCASRGNAGLKNTQNLDSAGSLEHATENRVRLGLFLARGGTGIEYTRHETKIYVRTII